MKTPITEHPEFPNILQSEAESFSNITLSLTAIYEKGAKAAQQILVVEHDREMEEFARWIIKKADTLEFLPLSGGKWAQVPENSKYDIPFNEVLSIFRKERENAI